MLQSTTTLTILLFSCALSKIFAQELPLIHEENLSNIQTLKIQNGTSIFFIDTTVLKYRRAEIVVDARTACAVESAARLHQDRDIYLLFTYPGYVTYDGSESEDYIRRLWSYDNINFAYINIAQYLNNTPAQKLVRNKTVEYSKWKVVHYSDLLRLVTLWRYGGVYFDVDVVVFKSLDDLKTQNFIGVENDQFVSSSVFGFTNDGLGQQYVTWLLSEFVKKYDYKHWSSNGRILFTRFVNKLCKTEKVGQAVDKKCEQLTVFPKEYFAPVSHTDWKMYFDEKFDRQIGNLTRNAYVVHMWRRYSSLDKLILISNAPYLSFARKFCPGVFRKVRKYF